MGSGSQFRIGTAQQGQRHGGDQPPGIVHGAIGREQAEPHELHARLRRKLATQHADAQLDSAVERGRRGQAPLVDGSGLGAVFGLGAETDEAPAAGAAGGGHELKVRGEVGLDLAGIPMVRVANALPGEIADDLGRRVPEHTGDGVGVCQVSLHHRGRRAEIGQAPGVAPWPHERGDREPAAEKRTRDVRADEPSRARQENPHRRQPR